MVAHLEDGAVVSLQAICRNHALESLETLSLSGVLEER